MKIEKITTSYQYTKLFTNGTPLKTQVYIKYEKGDEDFLLIKPLVCNLNGCFDVVKEQGFSNPVPLTVLEWKIVESGNYVHEINIDSSIQFAVKGENASSSGGSVDIDLFPI